MEVRGSLSANWCTISCYRSLVAKNAEFEVLSAALGVVRSRALFTDSYWFWIGFIVPTVRTGHTNRPIATMVDVFAAAAFAVGVSHL